MAWPLTSPGEIGCDWLVAGIRCGRTDIALQEATGNGKLCFCHAEAWLEDQRALRERQSAEYVTRSPQAVTT